MRAMGLIQKPVGAQQSRSAWPCDDDIEDSDNDDGPHTHAPCPRTHAPSTPAPNSVPVKAVALHLPPTTSAPQSRPLPPSQPHSMLLQLPAATHMPRSSFVTDMQLSKTQLGEAATTKSSGRTSGPRHMGEHSLFVHREANEAVAATQMLLVKHGIGGSAGLSFEALCTAMHAVRHLVLRKTCVVAMAPLVILECEDEAEDDRMLQAVGPPTSTVDAVADGLPRALPVSMPSTAPAKSLRIAMHRTTFDRACGNGSRFVVFGPFRKVRGTLLVSHAEALPYRTWGSTSF